MRTHRTEIRLKPGNSKPHSYVSTCTALAVYQAIAHGLVELYMIDVISSDYFSIVTRDVMGPKTLVSAHRGMTKFGMLEIAPSRRESRSNSPHGPDPTRNGRT